MPQPVRSTQPIDLRFLAGPRSRWKEFLSVVHIAREFIYGFRKLHFVGPCVTFFGSARFTEDHPYYKAAQELAGRVGRVGFTIMTGGGPGIMEAANRGARDVGARSVGCNIVLPMEQYANPYLDVSLTFDRFYVRKVLLLKYSVAFVVMPGGAGTVDELFETVTLIQTGKVKNFPILLYGKDYWAPMLQQIDRMVAEGTIGRKELEFVFVADSVEEATTLLQDRLVAMWQEAHKRSDAPRWWFLEDRVNGTIRSR
ncbi:MAG: TIGR00730 family Rossman fold protein [Flavobacteriales bacterium]|nr:TIGR00730 family Rossman fold protein [Flavobacteriales bacterium]